jgi:histidinol dehydrogenase
LAAAVSIELGKQLDELPRKAIAAAALETSAIIIVQNLTDAAEIANKIAPEHLEIATEHPFDILPLIRHAGSVFLGHYTTESLGDYMAGPNHTLPTSGTARFASALTVDDFCRRSSYLYYSEAAFREIAPDVAVFAEREGLQAHARAAQVRV